MADRVDGTLRLEAAHPSTIASSPPASDRRRRRMVVIGSVSLVLVLLVSLFAYGLTRDPTELRSALIDRAAPPFALTTLDGRSIVRLADLRGQVVVVNFWASWCAPCRQEHPALAEAWNRYRDRGVVLVGVLHDDTVTNGLDYVEVQGGDWPFVSDPGSRTALAFGIYGVPETFFIGRDGIVRHRHVGPVTYEVLTDRISDLLQRTDP